MEVILNKWQSKVWDDDHRFKIVCAGRRSGKSVYSQLTTINWASKVKGLYWIVAPTYVQAKQIHWRGIQEYIPQNIIRKKNEAELSIEFTNGSIIQLKSAENPDSLRGVKLNGLVIDEIASIRNWDWLWSEVLRPTLTDYEAPALFISTPKGFNHFYELFELGQHNAEDNVYKSFRFTSYENPYIPKEEVDQAKKEITEDTFAQEYLADFRKYTGLVFKEFDREIHAIEPFEIPGDWSIYRGVDFGSTNPTACLWVAVDKDENIFVVSEHYETGQTIDYHAGRINSNPFSSRVSATYGDPSGAQWITEFAQRGVHITPAEKDTGTSLNNWVRIGIEKIAEKLKIVPGHNVFTPDGKNSVSGNPSLFIFKDCVKTIMEFETYRWKEKSVTQAQDLNEPDVPEKANDHCFVGDTKILTKNGWKQINKIKRGEYVWSPFGWNKVYRAGSTGFKKVKDYGVFKCTPDHKVLTNHGLVEVDNLGYSDKIMVWEDRKPFTFKEFLTAVIQLRKRDQIGFIIGALLTKSLMARRDFYTETYGNSIKVKFLKAIWYTILTVTLIITTFTTLSLSLIVSMLKNITGVFGKEWKNTSTTFGFSQKNGMGLKREGLGIRSMRSKGGKIVNNIFENAMFVVRHTKHHLSSDQNIVRGAVKLQHYEEEEVFNLATKFGCYFANGVLVSNSMDALRYLVVSKHKSQPITPDMLPKYEPADPHIGI